MTTKYIPSGIKKYAYSGAPVSLHDPYRCPHCGSDTVHHETVDIVARGRTTPPCTHIVVLGTDVSVDNKYDVYPAAADSHIRMGFWCEACGETHEKTFLHHEGLMTTSTTPHPASTARGGGGQ